MVTDGQKIWSFVLAGIKGQVSSSTFKTWFGGSYVESFEKHSDNNILTIAVKNSFLKEQVENRYLPVITGILKEKGFEETKIVFVVGNKTQQNSKPLEPLFSGVALKLMTHRQPSALNPIYTFTNFVVGASNNIAYLAAKQVVSKPGSVYNPLLVYGPTGVGKTHLLQAIGAEIAKNFPDSKVTYASSEKFTNDYIEALNNRLLPTFRQKYRGCDVLIIDDVHFFAGKESTQDEFFHAFCDLHLSGRQIILACDRHPRELSRLKERLLSRFLGGMMVDVGYPDMEMKMAIIKKRLSEEGVNLDDDMVSYIATSTSGGVRELEGVLVGILAQLKLTGSVGKDIVEQLVGLKRDVLGKVISFGDAAGAICRHFKIDEAKLKGSSRKAKVVLARQFLMYILRKEANFSLGTIGDYLGGRDHSTVIHGVDKVEQMVVNNQAVRDELLRVRALI